MDRKDTLIARPLNPHQITTLEDEETTSGSNSTRSLEVIQRWAKCYGAEPATGEETASGPSSSLHVTDGGAGIRFNFPGSGPFRPISWDEWFGNFEAHGLTLVYEHSASGSKAMPRYRLVKTAEWQGQV